MYEQLHAVEALMDKRDIKKAEVLIARYLRTELADDQRARMMILRARTRLMSARPDEAIDDLQAAKALLQDAFESAINLELVADCHLARFELSSVGFADRNDVRLAQEYFHDIMARYPAYDNLGWVYYQLGRVHLTENEIEQAVSRFQEALLKPSQETALTAFCYERLGFVAYYEERDLDKALVFLDKALNTYTAGERLWLVQLHILRSRVFRDMYKFDRALKAAEEAVAVASKNRVDDKVALAEALFTLGELLVKLEGREKDVVTYLQQFLQVSKRPVGVDVTWSRVHDMLGDAYFKLGRYDQAASAYLAALQFNPYHPWEVSIYYRIARSFYQRNDYEKAVEAIHKMLEAADAEGQKVNDYQVYDVLGNALFALGNYPKAAEAYAMALESAPANAENLDVIRSYYQYALELS